jgi:hypothetical protein
MEIAMTFVGFKRPRIKNEKHLDFIRSLPCVCCGNNIQTEAAHIRMVNQYYGKETTGMQTKPDDKWTLPLCGEHHREQHRGNELAFWRRYNVDPFILALTLYAHSGDVDTAELVIIRQRVAA